MAPTKKPQKAAKKEKVFHPESRKAGQLARKQIRKSKLAGQASNRAKLHSSKGKLRQLFNFRLILRDSSYFFSIPFPLPFFLTADFYGFFFHAIPPKDSERGNVLSLSELHELVADVWLTRHDAELEDERAARRKGRPKSTKEQKLEQVQLCEAEEYRTGMGEHAAFFCLFHRTSFWTRELILRFLFCFSPTRFAKSTNQSEVPDLTHPDNVALYRTWDQREVAFLQLLRFIRISSSKPDTAIVSKPGKHPSLVPLEEFSSPMDVEAGA